MIKTACKRCLGGCTVIATVENGGLAHLEGNPKLQIWGTLCAKGLASIQDAYKMASSICVTCIRRLCEGSQEGKHAACEAGCPAKTKHVGLIGDVIWPPS